MAILQAIVSLVGRFLGRLLSAAFGWAVVALFGQTGSREKVLLSGLVAAAAAWPVLMLGVLFPRVATFVLVLAPIPFTVPTWVIRVAWIALAAAVPIAIGLTMAFRRPAGGAAAVRPPTRPVAGAAPVPRTESRLVRAMRGVPVTFALAVSFLLVFVTVPALRVIALWRRWVDVQVPLITETQGYDAVADEIERTLRRHRFEVRLADPPWWVTLPSRILLRLGGPAFREYVPERLVFIAGPRLEAALYPNGLLLRGLATETAWAHGVLVEALTAVPAYQTFDPRAQDIEKQIRSVWQVYRGAPEAHRGSRVLLARLMEITQEIRTLPVTYDEWQIVYRQALQLGRALDGAGQLLEDASRAQGLVSEGATLDTPLPEWGWEETTMAPVTNGSTAGTTARVHDLSTTSLIGQITGKASLLARKEVMLARAEIRADIESELAMLKGLAPALLAALFGVQMLLTALVFAMTRFMPGWLAALALGVGLLVAAAVLGYVSWNRRVTEPLALTRKTLKEDLRWAKERMA